MRFPPRALSVTWLALAVGLGMAGCGSAAGPGSEPPGDRDAAEPSGGDGTKDAAPGASGPDASPTGGAPDGAAAPLSAPDARDVGFAGQADVDVDVDAGVAADGARPNGILVFTRTTGFRHQSIEAAAAALRQALTGQGFAVEVSDDPKLFTRPGLSRFAAVILVSTTGKPLGDPGTEALDALTAFVREGGALVGLHAASSTFYEPNQPYTPLIGGKFIDHPGGVRMSLCHAEGTFTSVMRLPSPFPVRDEIYRFENLRADNVIDLRCDAVGGGRLPIAWHRSEGAGRVFYTGLGHENADWSATAVVFKDHMLPGILWALGR